MPVSPLSRAVVALPFAVGTLAIAGLVHLATVFSYPGRATNDAFARIAAIAPIGTKTDLPPAYRGEIPFRDAAMLTAVCRYDLTAAPFGIEVAALDQGFVSIGFHGRSGVAYYGLNLNVGEGGNLDLVVTADAQKTPGDAGQGNDPHQLKIAAPEREGFVVIEAPTDGPAGGRAALDHVRCGVKPESASRQPRPEGSD